MVAIFAIAFAFVEAAVVVYLRHLLGAAQAGLVPSGDVLLLLPGIAFLEPQTAVKIITDTALLNIERIREAATIVMLLSVALLVGTRFWEKVAYFLFSFGIWDIFYYVFLRLTISWPTSLSDPDVFFLLPVPWVGPVFVPVLISLGLVVGSIIYLFGQERKKIKNG